LLDCMVRGVHPAETPGGIEVAKAPTSKLGVGLVMMGFALVCAYVRPVGFHKSAAALIASMLLGPPSVVLA
jgi:hypothetical protein